MMNHKAVEANLVVVPISSRTGLEIVDGLLLGGQVLLCCLKLLLETLDFLVKLARVRRSRGRGRLAGFGWIVELCNTCA